MKQSFSLKNKVFGASLVASILAGCSISDDNELHYCFPSIDPLCDFQKYFGSYESGNELAFRHSNGYDFKMVVVKDSVYYWAADGKTYAQERDIPCIPSGSERTARRLRSVRLEAEYPMLAIDLEMDGSNSGEQDIRAYFGTHKFALKSYVPDTVEGIPYFSNSVNSVSTVGLENVELIGDFEINGKAYTNVFAVVELNPSSEEKATKIYYNRDQGIIKIEFDDGSFVGLKGGEE